ncbi:MAG: amidohydrolase family protein [Planctomycetota bacterium]|nr:amidohydrolase family protein [Planctomycetota bacterium]
MTIVDFHTHFFSDTYFRTLAAQSPATGDVDAKLARVSTRAGFALPPASTAEHTARWIAEMDRHDIAHLCTFASVPEEVPIVCEAAALSKGRISAFALVNPRVEGAAVRLGALLAAGRVRGALVFPALHHWRWDGPEAKALLQVLDEHGAILYAHCGLLVVKVRDLLELPRVADINYANPLSLVPAANAHRRVRFVIPHFGAGFLRETMLLGAQCDNVYVDTSSSNSWRSVLCPKPTLTEVFQRTLEVFGPERVVFGTDSNTFPAGWRQDRHEEQRRALLQAGADENTLELVFGGNARRMLGLS